MRDQQVMSEVVRRRLAALAQIPAEAADRAEPDPPAEEPVLGAEARRGVPPGPPHALGRVWEFTRQHLAAVAVVLLVGVASTAWATTQSRTTPVASASPTKVAVAEPDPEPTASPSPPPMIQVHVMGAVASPGVVMLAEGARVHEAVTAAGGLKPGARPGTLNLASVVADGAQIVIGTKDAPGGEVTGTPDSGGGAVVSGQSASSAQKIDLNTATAEQLDTLPGVGPVTAGNIISWRTAHGSFSRVEELTEVDGIGPKTYARLADLVRVG